MPLVVQAFNLSGATCGIDFSSFSAGNNNSSSTNPRKEQSQNQHHHHKEDETKCSPLHSSPLSRPCSRPSFTAFVKNGRLLFLITGFSCMQLFRDLFTLNPLARSLLFGPSRPWRLKRIKTSDHIVPWPHKLRPSSKALV
jgi:hypothetical protein